MHSESSRFQSDIRDFLNKYFENTTFDTKSLKKVFFVTLAFTFDLTLALTNIVQT